MPLNFACRVQTSINILLYKVYDVDRWIILVDLHSTIILLHSIVVMIYKVVVHKVVYNVLKHRILHITHIIVYIGTLYFISYSIHNSYLRRSSGTDPPLPPYGARGRRESLNPIKKMLHHSHLTLMFYLLKC